MLLVWFSSVLTILTKNYDKDFAKVELKIKCKSYNVLVSIMSRILLWLSLLCGISCKYDANWASLDSRPLPSWYNESKFGIFITWGVFSVPGFGGFGPTAPHLPSFLWYFWKSKYENKIKIKTLHPTTILHFLGDTCRFVLILRYYFS